MIVLKATQDQVLSVLQSVAGIVERRHTLPILANVLVRKTGSSLQFTTSDLEIQIRTSTLARIGKVWRRSTIPATDCNTDNTWSCVAFKTIM